METLNKLVAAAVLCSTPMWAQAVRTDHAKDVDLAQYHTYCFGKVDTGSELTNHEVEDAAMRNMQMHNIMPAGPANCDLTIMAVGSPSDKKVYANFYNGLQGGWNWANWRTAWSDPGTYDAVGVGQIPAKTLVVDIYDTNSKQEVFRGIAHESLSTHPEKDNIRVVKAVNKIYEHFPGHAKTETIVGR